MLINTITAIIFGVVVLYLISAMVIIRSVIKHTSNVKPEVHNEYTKVNKQDNAYDYVIISNQCPICQRIDKIHIDEEELEELCDESSINVGKYPIVHSEGLGVEEHTVTHYLSEIGEHIGEEIPYEDLRHIADQRELTSVT